MKGLIEIFYEPGKVFDYVREHRAWVIPFLANLILFLGAWAYTTQAIGAGNIVRHSLENNKFAAQMPADAKEKAIADADTTPKKVQTGVFATIGFVVLMLVFSLLFKLIAGVSGGKLSFWQAVGTLSYASWPIGVVRTLISLLVIGMAADKSDLDPQHLLAFNAGAFLDKAATAKPLYSLASSFDLIIFAQIALAAFGVSRVSGISFTKAIVGLMLIWAVFTVLGMGLSLVF